MDKREEFDVEFDFEKEYGFDPSLMDNNYEEEPEFLQPMMPQEAPVETPEMEVPAFSENDMDAIPEFGNMFEEPVYDEAAEPAPYYDEAQEYPMEEAYEEEVPQQPQRRKRDRRPNRFNPLKALLPKQKPAAPAAPVEPAAPVDEATIFGEPEAEAVSEAPVAYTEPAAYAEPAAYTETAGEAAPVSEEIAQEAPRPEQPQRRRRKRTKQQIFKEVYLPPIIAGVALLLILIMVIGSIVRAVNGGSNGDHGANSDEEQAALDAEAETLMAQAELLAAGYDYNAAIKTLDSFSGEQSAYPEMLTARSSYAKAQEQLIEWRDPSAVPNLSFHVLIADPARAFTNESLGKSYNKNFVTVDEFEKILQQLYDNNYVLVSLEDVVFSTTTDGNTTYSANTIYLPDGKKPIMITETMVNYYGYMIDSDEDGKADAKGAGFASKLVLDANGEITAEMVNSSGETVQGNYDLVPILNDFIEAHPDFSYQGARAILAVSGKEGVFGYRTNKGDAAEIEAAQEIVAKLREDGYTIACYTYSDMNYGSASATEIQADLQKWTAEVTPVLGNVDILVYAKATDITDYKGNQYNVLYNAGFRYFIGTGALATAKVTDDYFHQRRIMVTGTQMAHGSNVYTSYFNAMAVLNSSRGNVPQ